MEIVTQEPKRIKFSGHGSDYFVLCFVNVLLSIITLGLYYPWAKVKMLKYLYQETELEGSRFSFNGTGKEIFIGFLKTFAILFVLYLGLFLSVLSGNIYVILPFAAFFILFLFLFIPLAVHGALRYRLSRTTWRSIHFGYRGNKWVLMGKFVGGFLLTIITLGIYGSWFTIDLRKYIIGNIRFGSLRFAYKGSGIDYFLLNLVGILLSFITLGIYSFWYAKNLFEFYINNIEIEHGDKKYSIKSTASAGKIFLLFIGNLLLIVFTLGIASPVVTVRNIRFLFNNIELDSSINSSEIIQTEEEYKDATGDDMLSFFDIDLV